MRNHLACGCFVCKKYVQCTMIEFFLKCRKDLTAIHEAAMEGDVKVLQKIWRMRPQPFIGQKNNTGRTALHIAICLFVYLFKETHSHNLIYIQQ